MNLRVFSENLQFDPTLQLGTKEYGHFDKCRQRYRYESNEIIETWFHENWSQL